MRKCIALVIYNKRPYELYELKVITSKGDIITLATYDEINSKPSHYYENFHDFYSMILRWLKNNNFTLYKYNSFDLDFYSIIWVDIKHPEQSIQKYGYRKDK